MKEPEWEQLTWSPEDFLANLYGMQGGWVCMLKQNPRTYPDSFCSEGRNAEYEAKEAGDEVCEDCMIRHSEDK